MAKERNALKAGIFIAVSVVLAVSVVFGITGTAVFFQPKQTRKIIFTLHDDIGGLQAGDPVRIGGFTVGTVYSIDVVEEHTAQASAMPHTEITITLPKKYVIRENARVEINGTLTGVSWLNFTTLGEGNPLADNVTIAGSSGGMSAMFGQLSEIIPRLKETVALVNEKTLPALNNDLAKLGTTADSFVRVAGSGNDLIVHFNGKIDPLITRVSTAAENASTTLVQIKDLAHHADTNVLPNVAAATGTIKEKLPGIMDQVSGLLTKGSKSLDAATDTLAEVKGTFVNAKQFAGTARDVVADNKSKLEGMINSLKQTADNLKGASVEIRHSPWRLIYKPAPEEMGNLNIYDAARQFAEGAGALEESAQALRDAGNNKNSTPQELQARMDELNKQFAKFNAVEEQLWKAVKE